MPSADRVDSTRRKQINKSRAKNVRARRKELLDSTAPPKPVSPSAGRNEPALRRNLAQARGRAAAARQDARDNAPRRITQSAKRNDPDVQRAAVKRITTQRSNRHAIAKLLAQNDVLKGQEVAIHDLQDTGLLKGLGTREKREARARLQNELVADPVHIQDRSVGREEKTSGFNPKGILHAIGSVVEGANDLLPNHSVIPSQKTPSSSNDAVLRLNAEQRKIATGTTNGVLKGLSQLTRLSSASAGAAEAVVDHKNPLTGAVEGAISNKRSYSELAKKAGLHGTAAAALGLTGDILLDPSTYISLGATVPARAAAEGAVRAALKVEGKANAKIIADAARAGKPLDKDALQAMQAATRKTAERAGRAAEAKVAAKAGPAAQTRGVQAGVRVPGIPFTPVKPRTIRTSGRGTARLANVTHLDRATDRVVQSKVVNQTLTRIAPSVRPTGVSKSDWNHFRTVERRSRAIYERVARDSTNVGRTIMHATGGDEKQMASIVDAIEAQKFEKLDPKLEKVARLADEHFQRVSAEAERYGIHLRLHDFIFNSDQVKAVMARALHAVGRADERAAQIEAKLTNAERVVLRRERDRLGGKNAGIREETAPTYSHGREEVNAQGTLFDSRGMVRPVREPVAAGAVDDALPVSQGEQLQLAPHVAEQGPAPKFPEPPKSILLDESKHGNYELRRTRDGRHFVWDKADGEILGKVDSTGAGGGYMKSVENARQRFADWAYHDLLPGGQPHSPLPGHTIDKTGIGKVHDELDVIASEHLADEIVSLGRGRLTTEQAQRLGKFLDEELADGGQLTAAHIKESGESAASARAVEKQARVLRDRVAKILEPTPAPVPLQAAKVNAKEFNEAFVKALEGDKGAFLSRYTDAERAQHKAFLAHDGKVGGALKFRDDGGVEIVSLFNMGGPRGSGKQMMSHLLREAERTGRPIHLDAIGDDLRQTYEALGFRTTLTHEFDPAQVPAGHEEKFGRTDYYEMTYDPRHGPRDQGTDQAAAGSFWEADPGAGDQLARGAAEAPGAAGLDPVQRVRGEDGSGADLPLERVFRKKKSRVYTGRDRRIDENAARVREINQQLEAARKGERVSAEVKEVQEHIANLGVISEQLAEGVLLTREAEQKLLETLDRTAHITGDDKLRELVDQMKLQASKPRVEGYVPRRTAESLDALLERFQPPGPSSAHSQKEMGAQRQRSFRGTMAQARVENPGKYSENLPLLTGLYGPEAGQRLSAGFFFTEAMNRMGRRASKAEITQGMDEGAVLMFRDPRGRVHFENLSDPGAETSRALKLDGEHDPLGRDYVVVDASTAKLLLPRLATMGEPYVVMQGYDTFLRKWKGLNTIARPAFFGNTMIGNAWQSYLADVSMHELLAGYRAAIGAGAANRAAGKIDGRTWSRAVDKLFSNHELRIDGVPMTEGELFEEAMAAGATKVGSQKVDPTSELSVPRLTQKDIEGGPLMRRLVGAGKAVNLRPVAALSSLSELLDDAARMSIYRSARVHGMSPDQATDRVSHYMIDYGDLSPAERKYMKRLMPFYMFSARNLPMQVRAAVKRPGKLASFEKARQAIAQAVGLPDGWEQELTQSDQERFPVPTGMFTDGHRRNDAGDIVPHKFRVMITPRLPNEDLSRISGALTADTPGKGLERLGQRYLGDVTPFLKTPLELLLNTNSQYNRPIDTGKKSEAGFAEQALMKLVGKDTKRDQVDPRTGKTFVGINPRVDYLLRQTGGSLPGLLLALGKHSTDRGGVSTEMRGIRQLSPSGLNAPDPYDTLIDTLYKAKDKTQKRKAALEHTKGGTDTTEYVRIQRQAKDVAEALTKVKAAQGAEDAQSHVKDIRKRELTELLKGGRKSDQMLLQEKRMKEIKKKMGIAG